MTLPEGMVKSRKVAPLTGHNLTCARGLFQDWSLQHSLVKSHLHAKLGVLEHLNLFDIVLGKDRSGAANGAKVETAVLFASIGDSLAAVTLCEGDEGPAILLEKIDV